MHYPEEILQVAKVVKTDIASYYVEIRVNTEENGIEIDVYTPDKTGFILKQRKLLVSRWFTLKDTGIDGYIADTLREYEKPFRLVRNFEAWDGYIDLSKDTEEKEQATAARTVNINVDGKEVFNNLFSNLKNIAQRKPREIKVYDWEDNLTSCKAQEKR